MTTRTSFADEEEIRAGQGFARSKGLQASFVGPQVLLERKDLIARAALAHLAYLGSETALGRVNEVVGDAKAEREVRNVTRLVPRRSADVEPAELTG